MVHKIHMGAELVKQGYNYNASAEGQFNEVKFPQDLRNCTKCHDNSAAAVNPTPDGNNWHRVPSPLACGACHDGIKFDSTSGKTLGGANTGHGGVNLVGPADASDPAKCSSCHTSDGIQFVHTPVTPPNPANSLLLGGTNTNTNAASIASNTARLPAGAIKVTYDIQSVSRNASKQPVMVFRMLQDGVAVPFQTYAAGVTTEIWNHFFGAPSVYFVFAVPQDGVAKPADFNASASGYLRSIWNGTATGTGAGTLTGPDASGYYKATLTGVQVPDSAVMLTGGLGYSYNVTSSLPLTQDNVNGYPASAATATTGLNATMPNKIGGLIVIAPDAQKVATGYTARRAIIDDAKCNKCHQELGAFTAEAFHAGQRNDGSTCSWCHTPNRASSGWSADSTNFVHAIHGNSKRAVDFTWHAASITDGLWKVGYPGVLKNCSACHLPGTYNFGATASASAVPNRLYRTVATGKFNGTSADPVANFALSPYVVKDNVYNYGAGFAFNASATAASNITKADGTVFSNPAQGVFNAEGTTLVDSPISTVCFACHDSAAARGHIELNGGSIYAARSTALGKAEQCVVCHAAGKEQDIEALHAK